MAHVKDESDVNSGSDELLCFKCGDDGRLRFLFDQVVVNKDVVRPFPPKLRDDLFTLFMAVRKTGGYESVSKKELWESVAGECGIDVKKVASLKLIYVKYLKELDQCLLRFGKEEKFDSLLEKYKGSLSTREEVSVKKKKKKKLVNDDKRRSVVRFGRKRREGSLSLSGMLGWVVEAARNPHDTAIGTLPKASKWKKYDGNLVWKQALLAREALFPKPNVDSGGGLRKKRQRMHPSVYDDNKVPIHLSSKRIRCSQRVASLKSCSCPGCCIWRRSSSQNKRHKKTPPDQTPTTANVPEWTGVVSESDPKWLGTRMWGPGPGPHETDLGAIGKGRESSLCECLVPGSVDCVRFHVAERRTKVKAALGPLFYRWKFDCMGEEGSSVSWSTEEENEFKSLVIKSRQELRHRSKSRQDIMNKFWKRASEALPDKTKENLVSYYFNAFVLRRRSYQNRVMPQDIDSDNDEE